MRSINHLAAALLAPFISGEEYAKRFYGLWDKKNQRGGCIFRVDDMSEIKDVYSALNKSTLSNSMKKGFKKVLETLDTYQLAKYKDTVIDIANLVHPKSSLSTAMITTSNGEKMRTLDALIAAKRYLQLLRSVSIVEPGLMVGMKQQQLQFRTLILHQRQLQKIQRRTPKVRLAKVLLQQLSVLFLFPQVHISIFSIQKR